MLRSLASNAEQDYSTPKHGTKNIPIQCAHGLSFLLIYFASARISMSAVLYDGEKNAAVSSRKDYLDVSTFESTQTSVWHVNGLLTLSGGYLRPCLSAMPWVRTNVKVPYVNWQWGSYINRRLPGTHENQFNLIL